MQTSSQRTALRNKFLRQHDCRVNEVTPLAPDASFRRYFRIKTDTDSYLLMDAPPSHEDIQPFIKVAQHLQQLGLYAPKIHAYDITNGFILLQDFGEETFTRLLEAGGYEADLYEKAVSVLNWIHTHPSAADIDIPAYDNHALLSEAALFTDWYFPAIAGQRINNEARKAYLSCWENLFMSLPPVTPTLVLRDYHVDNLMLIAGSGECGLLDFQDALLGPPAYDLVSLLEDARRDIAPELIEKMRDRYFSMVSVDQETFDLWYTTLGVQRHCKVAGIFVRLAIRDNKYTYLRHIPRVLRLLNSHLHLPHFQSMKMWLETHFSDWNSPHLDLNPDKIKRLSKQAFNLRKL